MNERYPAKDWPFTTYFEDVILPGHALTLDAATMYDHYPGQDWNEQDWFWRFTICVGAIGSDDARIVLARSMDLLANLLEYEEAVLAKRKEINPDEDPRIMFDQWIVSLRMIIQAAQGKKHCFWIAGYEDDLEFMKERKRRFLLPEDHPDYLPPPHIHSLILNLDRAAKRLSQAERAFEARANKRKKQENNKFKPQFKA